MSVRPTVLSAVLSLFALGSGCASELELKGEEEDAPIDGAFDSFARPTDHGALTLGDGVQATISSDEKFHSWTFTLPGSGRVTFRTSGFVRGKEIDTVLYLYREGPRGWGRYIARNDDAFEGVNASKLESELEAGRYRVLVKGHDSRVRGLFELDSECAGRGCGGANATKPNVTCSLTRRDGIAGGGPSAVEATIDTSDPDAYAYSESVRAFEGYYSFGLTASDGRLDVIMQENEHVQDEVGSFGCDIVPGAFCADEIIVDKNLGTGSDEDVTVHALDFACRSH